MINPMFGSTRQESVPTCVHDCAAAGPENAAPNESVTSSKQIRSMVVALSLRNISSYDRPHIRFDLAMTGSHARRCMDCIVAKPGSKDVLSSREWIATHSRCSRSVDCKVDQSPVRTTQQ